MSHNNQLPSLNNLAPIGIACGFPKTFAPSSFVAGDHLGLFGAAQAAQRGGSLTRLRDSVDVGRLRSGVELLSRRIFCYALAGGTIENPIAYLALRFSF